MSRYNGYLLNVVKPCMQPLYDLAQFSWIMETLNCSVMSKFFDDVCNSGEQLHLTRYEYEVVQRLNKLERINLINELIKKTSRCKTVEGCIRVLEDTIKALENEKDD